MDDFFTRSEALLGEKAMETLRNTRVIIFGVGGVGSYAAEALIRTGLTHLTIVTTNRISGTIPPMVRICMAIQDGQH